MQGKNARKVRKDVNLKLVIGIVSAVLILSICVGLLVCYTITDKIVSENVYVNSIYVGGMSAEEATAKITSTVTKDYFNKIVTINYGDKSYDLRKLALKILPHTQAFRHQHYDRIYCCKYEAH